MKIYCCGKDDKDNQTYGKEEKGNKKPKVNSNK